MITALIFVIPLALLLSLLFVIAFLKSANSGQFDDLETPAIRILKDDTERKEKL